jgi:hypothetical protein
VPNPLLNYHPVQRFCLSLFATFIFITAHSQTVYWQQQVDYLMDVTLNEKERTLDAFQKLTYKNNSPDTLTFIWFHIWPNAYKNDRTAFSDQMLRQGNTKFYFADKEERGYINRLDFKVDGVSAKLEDHPQHIDIIKLVLPAPLPPGNALVITTPFHVKLPYNFSRGGWYKNSFQITQWYPKPAVYDAQGWHPMTYLNQGEFYSEFGNFDVRITLPGDYVVAATGALQNEGEKKWMKQRTVPELKQTTTARAKPGTRPANKIAKNLKAATQSPPAVAITQTKTLRFIQQNVHDFAFFADKDFIVSSDSCQLGSGRVIEVATYYTPAYKSTWRNSLQLAKDAVRFYSTEVGEYPYETLSAVQGPQSFGGGMEYPTVTVIAPTLSEKDLDITLAHEIGHNWFYGILASNERDHPWMDEGLNSFYEKKYTTAKYGSQDQLEEIGFQTLARSKSDQPVVTTSEDFNYMNYGLVAYYKTARWLQLMEAKLGREKFSAAMQQYYQRWKFKHPQPSDLKAAFAPTTGSETDHYFGLIQIKGTLPNQQLTGLKILTPLQPKSFKSYLEEPSKKALFLSPLLGANKYDGVMVGGIITNYILPPSPFQFLAIPLYGTGSKKANGIAKASYTFYPDAAFKKIEVGISGLWFSKNQYPDSNNQKVFERFGKISPSIRASLKQSLHSSKENWIEARSYIIKENNFSKFVTKSTDNLNYVDSNAVSTRYVNSLTFFATDNRTLYPYDYTLQLHQGAGFYRVNLTGNYFFNYAGGGGASIRAFAAKFGYLNKNNPNNFSAFIYQPKLLAVTGEEDYTYSNYFIGRTASFANDGTVVNNAGIAAQQIMIVMEG